MTGRRQLAGWLPSGTIPWPSCLLEILHVIITYMHSWLKHITHILTHNCLLFNSRPLAHTQFFYTTVIIITAFSCSLFTHRDFKLGGLSLTHNLQWHFVYGYMRGDFVSICKRHLSPGCTGQFHGYALHLASLIGEWDSHNCPILEFGTCMSCIKIVETRAFISS